MQSPNTLKIALLAAAMVPWLIWTTPVAAQVNDGCDVGGGPNDIDTLTAALTDTALTVTMDLCADADAATKYQVFLTLPPLTPPMPTAMGIPSSMRMTSAFPPKTPP